MFTPRSLSALHVRALTRLCPHVSLQRGWEVQDGKVLFTPAPKCSAAKELPSLELINYTLTYAKELERIV